MESDSTRDGTPLAAGEQIPYAAPNQSDAEQMMQPGSSQRTAQASISAALTAANAALRDEVARVRFPGEDGGHSLAEMARRDLDAALQLLTERAQYITGSSGAAIALRRSGKNDMLCRASTGSNAPELGTLFSTEFGISGESVRTRRALRCDDAERDARVNRDVCREVGIASVVVMPVVHDDEVLGVFELFSEKAHAFGERDVSALERLSEMVETAVTLAEAAGGAVKAEPGDQAAKSGIFVADEDDRILETSEPAVEARAEVAPEPPQAALGLDATPSPEISDVGAILSEPEVVEAVAAATAEAARMQIAASASAHAGAAPVAAPLGPVPPGASAKKALLWSAALNMSGDTLKPADSDQSHVPLAFRNLRKCEACGFPVSEGRTLCVECEEKKWRGELKVPRSKAVYAAAAAAAATPAPIVRRPVATASQSVASPDVTATAPAAPSPVSIPAGAPAEAEAAPQIEPSGEPQSADTLAVPGFVLSAALEPPQSWLAKNKYILGALLLVAGTIAAILLVGRT